MISIEQTFAGLEITFRQRLAGRIGGFVFLSIWLTFWVVGEVLVAWLLLAGAWSLLTGLPPGAGRAPLQIGPALAGGAFLSVWLAFWTLGGFLAGREWLRLIAGKCRLVAGAETLCVETYLGFFVRRREIERRTLQRLYVLSSGTLHAECEHATEQLLQHDVGHELQRASEAINALYRLDALAPSAPALPSDWLEIESPEQERIVIHNPRHRRILSFSLWALFIPVALGAAFLVLATVRDLNLGALAAIMTAAAVLLGWGARRLTQQRDEWVLQSGRLRLQRRRGALATMQFEATALELHETRDSDGDPSFRLVALAATSTTEPAPLARDVSRPIDHAGSDATELRRFGQWLASRCQLPFRDRTGPEFREAERLQALAQLAASGRVGAWIAARLKRR